MTVITTILTKDHIAFGSDSLITRNINKHLTVVEDKESKFVHFRKLKCIVGYWGLARAYNNDGTIRWSLHDWLVRQQKVAERFLTIESFGLQLKKDLDNILNQGAASDVSEMGLGIHIAGFESINNLMFPELYLLTNFGFDNGFYKKVRETLEFSPRAFPTCKGANEIETLYDRRKFVRNYFESGKAMIFNNGDPILFNSLANGLEKVYDHTKPHLQERFSDEIAFLKFQSSYAIELAKNYQRDFYREDQIRIGGEIHSMVLTKEGQWL